MAHTVEVARIPAGGLEVDTAVPIHIAGSAEVVDQRPSVRLRARLHRTTQGVVVRGRIAAAVRLRCSRCAEEHQVEVEDALEAFFAERMVPEGADVRLEEEDLSVTSIEDGKVDLCALAHDQTVLALPSKPLCRADCRGLCPQCGADRNAGECECSDEWVDPRLAVLQGLLR